MISWHKWDKQTDEVTQYDTLQEYLDSVIAQGPIRDEPVRVAEDYVGQTHISTIFLEVGVGENPLLFETMVFGGIVADRWQERYATPAAAKAGHDQMVKRVRDLYAAN